MRVGYRLGSFVSHRRAGRDNILALRRAGVEVPEEADGVSETVACIIHDEPWFLARHLSELSGSWQRRGPLIAYAVFETDRAPAAWEPLLAPVRQVWTCSEHSRAALSRVHPDVRVVPHVVRRPRLTAEDLDFVRARLGRDAEGGNEYWFYAVSDAANPRKNLPALLRAFARLRAEGLPVRLALKQYRLALPGLERLPGVVSLSGEWSERQMAALHALCHCLVSPHRAEAWGLSLSQAMAFGRPVIATGHSGNMEFMHAGNSLPLRFRLREITAEDLAGLPRGPEPGMVWAEPDEEHLVECMRLAARGRMDPGLAERARQVARDFAPEAVGKVMAGLLAELLAEPLG